MSRLLPNDGCARRAGAFFAGFLVLGVLAPLPAAVASPADPARAALERGRAAYQQGRLKQAAEHYTTALSLFQAQSDETHQGICLTNLGLVYLDLGDYAVAQSYSEQAVALRSRSGDRRGVARSLNNLGVALSAQGHYREARAQLQKALELNRQIGDVEGTVINYRNIGLVYFYSGRYMAVLTQYHKALAIIATQDGAPWAAREHWAVLNDLGATYKKLGWYERALSIYLELLKQPALDPKDRAYAWNNLGTIYRSLGDPIKAKEYYERALREAERLQNSTAQALLLKNLGRLHSLHLQDDPAAAEYLTASLALSQALGDPYEEANTYNQLGEVARRQGRLAAAQAAYEQALALAVTPALREARWTALYGLGQLRMARGDRPGAQKFYNEAIALIESVRTALPGGALRTGFLTDKLDVYEAGLQTLLAGPEAPADGAGRAKAFEYTERFKARAALDLLSEAAAQIEEGVPPDLQLRRQQLRQQLALLRSDRGAPGASDAESARRPAIERELEAIDLRVLESNPRYALVQEPKILTLADVPRQLLGAEDALLVFFTGKQSIWVWLITQAEVRIHRIANPATVAADVQTYVRHLTHPTSAAYSRLSAELYDTLLQPVLGALPAAITRLTVIPDGFLYTLPFETLQARGPDGAERARRFLIERYEISYAPSASVLGLLRHTSGRGARPEKALLGMSITDPGGEPDGPAEGRADHTGRGMLAGLSKLEYADLELRRIQSYVPGLKEIYLQGHSTKSVLTNRAAEHFKVLHFATHSVINEEAPENSFLVLSPDPERPDDALLWLYEIFNLRLSADLVVLSSCRSGLGQRLTGEGILGFTHAFMYAGAQSVITTFWEINDQATPFFMEQFYFHLGRGARPADALRRAKLKFLKSPGYAHPFYWGAFAITGNTSVPIYPFSYWKGWLLLAAGLAVGLLWLIRARWSAGRSIR